MKAIVFYSWQSDLPNKTNRGLIEEALEAVVEGLKQDDEVLVEPAIDRDTFGVPGSPDIGITIFSKIDSAAAMVCDVSLVTADAADRQMPNPNVLIELGYALKSLGAPKIIMVMNTAFGGPEKLPFDLRQKRVLTYALPENGDKAAARKVLVGKLIPALKPILQEHETDSGTDVAGERSTADALMESIRLARPDQGPLASRFMNGLAEELTKFDPHALPGESDENLVTAIAASRGLVDQFGRVAEAIADMNAEQAATSLTKSFEAILRLYDRPPGGGTVRNTDFDLFKFVGHEMCTVLFAHLMRASRWDLIGALTEQTLYVDHPSRGPGHIGLRVLSSHLVLLDVRAERTKTRQGKRISIHADLLKERHEGTTPVGGVNWDEFRAADLLLALVLETTAPSGFHFHWVPRSSIYLSGQTPRFLVDALKLPGARELGKAFREPDVAIVRTRVKAAMQRLGEGISQMSINVTVRARTPCQAETESGMVWAWRSDGRDARSGRS